MVERIISRGKESGRVDDNIDSLKKRFHTFVTETQKILDHYDGKNKVIKVYIHKTLIFYHILTRLMENLLLKRFSRN